MKDDLVPIYEAGSLMEAQLLADRLDQEGLQAHVANDQSPLDGLTAGEQTVRVMVLPADQPRAQAVVEQFVQERDAGA